MRNRCDGAREAQLDVPPYRRPVNMMFQSYALFPHLTVAGNVAFGLKQDGLPRPEIDARVTCKHGSATVIHTYQQDT